MSITDRRRMLSGKPFFVIFQANKVPLNSQYISGNNKYTVTADKITVGSENASSFSALLIKGTVTPRFSEYKTIHILAKAILGTADGQMRVDNQAQLFCSSIYGTPYITVSGKTEREYVLDISPTAKSFQFWTVKAQGSDKWSIGEITKIWLEK